MHKICQNIYNYMIYFTFRTLPDVDDFEDEQEKMIR